MYAEKQIMTRVPGKNKVEHSEPFFTYQVSNLKLTIALELSEVVRGGTAEDGVRREEKKVL